MRLRRVHVVRGSVEPIRVSVSDGDWMRSRRNRSIAVPCGISARGFSLRWRLEEVATSAFVSGNARVYGNAQVFQSPMEIGRGRDTGWPRRSEDC